jgi:hypothetical protein
MILDAGDSGGCPVPVPANVLVREDLNEMIGIVLYGLVHPYGE